MPGLYLMLNATFENRMLHDTIFCLFLPLLINCKDRNIHQFINIHTHHSSAYTTNEYQLHCTHHIQILFIASKKMNTNRAVHTFLYIFRTEYSISNTEDYDKKLFIILFAILILSTTIYIRPTYFFYVCSIEIDKKKAEQDGE